jgi:hypothetical protein
MIVWCDDAGCMGLMTSGGGDEMSQFLRKMNRLTC